jgi:hypothetical protein
MYNVEKVYKDCNIRLSTKAMSDLMYAIIMTHATMVTSYGVGIYSYTRKQNSYNGCDVKILIEEGYIPLFEQLSGVKLKNPIQTSLN